MNGELTPAVLESDIILSQHLHFNTIKEQAHEFLTSISI